MLPRSPDSNALISINYELDLASVAGLREQLASLAARSISKLTIDLTDCTYVDTAGIAELVTAYKRSLAEGFQLAFVIPAGLMRLFTIIGLDKIFAIFPTLGSAEAEGPAPNSLASGDAES